MLKIEEYTWAFRVIGTRSFGKFMPHTSLFPIGELLNHDNVQTFYIYQYPHEQPNAGDRYSGIVDDNDHDDPLLLNDSVLTFNNALILKINAEVNRIEKSSENYQHILKSCVERDSQDEKKELEHKKYRPSNIDLSERPEKEASICTGPNEHYLPGSEVYMSYGRYSNRQLLSTYGFALKENQFNYAFLRLQAKDLNDDPEKNDTFVKIAGYCGFKIKKNVVCEDLLSKLRGIYWKENYSHDAFFHAIEPKLEIRVLSQAILLINRYLAKFPTSYEEDLKILQEEIPLRKYFAVLYRSQIKEILNLQIKLLTTEKEKFETLLLTQSLSLEESKVAEDTSNV